VTNGFFLGQIVSKIDDFSTNDIQMDASELMKSTQDQKNIQKK